LNGQWRSLKAALIGEAGMTKGKPFRVTARIDSFRYALAGLAAMLRTQHNAWIHLAASGSVIGLGVALRISSGEWIAIILSIVLVWAAEALNTAFELLCDVASPEFHPLVKTAKDVAAGGVLIAALGALIVGALVFLPHL
jgi:diacylglycerol kinase (ATP)